MTESTVGWFVVREKYYSLAEKVQLINQANRTDITLGWVPSGGLALHRFSTDPISSIFHPILTQNWRAKSQLRMIWSTSSCSSYKGKGGKLLLLTDRCLVYQGRRQLVFFFFKCTNSLILWLWQRVFQFVKGRNSNRKLGKGLLVVV